MRNNDVNAWFPGQPIRHTEGTAVQETRGDQGGYIYTLQRQNTEILKQIFTEKEYRGLSPNFHIHTSVSDLYIPGSVCLFCWRKYVDLSWDYINRSQTHECGNWGWGRAIPRKGINKWDFHCSVGAARHMNSFILLKLETQLNSRTQLVRYRFFAVLWAVLYGLIRGWDLA